MKKQISFKNHIHFSKKKEKTQQFYFKFLPIIYLYNKKVHENIFFSQNLTNTTMCGIIIEINFGGYEMPEEKKDALKGKMTRNKGETSTYSNGRDTANFTSQNISLPNFPGTKKEQKLSVFDNFATGRNQNTKKLLIDIRKGYEPIAAFKIDEDTNKILLDVYDENLIKIFNKKNLNTKGLVIDSLELDKKLDIRVKALGKDIGVLFSAYGFQMKAKGPRDTIDNAVFKNEDAPYDIEIGERFLDMAIQNELSEEKSDKGCILGSDMKLDSPTMQSLLRMTAMNQPIFYDAIAQKTLGDKTDKSKQVVLTSTSYQFYDKNGNLQRRPMDFMEINGKLYVYLSIVEGEPRQRREHAGRFYELSEINLTDDNRIFFTIKDRSLVTVDRAHTNSRILEIPYAKDKNGSSKFVGFVSDIAKNYKIRNASENTPQANATLSNKEYGVRDDWKHSNQTIHNYDSAGFVRHDDAESVLRKDKAKETEPNIEPKSQPENTEEQAGSEAAEPETTSLVVSRENEDDNQDADEIVYGTISTGDPDVEFLQNYAGDTTNSVPPNSQTIDQPEETAEGPTFGYTFKNYNPLYTNDTTIVTESSTSDLSSLVENDHADAIENGRGGVLPERTETRDDVDPQPVPEPQPEPQQEPQPEPEPEPQSQSPADGGGNPTAPQEEEEIETQKKKSALDIPFIDKKGFDKDKSNELAAKVGTGILGVGVVLMAFSVIIAPILAPFVIVAFATSTIVFTKPWEWVQVSKSNAIDRANAKLAKEKLREIKRERIEENNLTNKNRLINENTAIDARVAMLNERKTALQKQNGILYMSADSGEDVLPENIKLINPKTLNELEIMSKADRRAYETHVGALLSLGITDETQMTDEQKKQLEFLEGSMKRDFNETSAGRIEAHQQDLVNIVTAFQKNRKEYAETKQKYDFDNLPQKMENERQEIDNLGKTPIVISYIELQKKIEANQTKIAEIENAETLLDETSDPKLREVYKAQRERLSAELKAYGEQLDGIYKSENANIVVDYMKHTSEFLALTLQHEEAKTKLQTLQEERDDLAIKMDIARAIVVNDAMMEAHKNDKPILTAEQRKAIEQVNSRAIEAIDGELNVLNSLKDKNGEIIKTIDKKSVKDHSKQTEEQATKNSQAFDSTRRVLKGTDDYLKYSTASAAVQAEQDYIKAQQEEQKNMARLFNQEIDKLRQEGITGDELTERLKKLFEVHFNIAERSSPDPFKPVWENKEQQTRKEFNYPREQKNADKQIVEPATDKDAVKA